jgi:hypothetical protein
MPMFTLSPNESRAYALPIPPTASAAASNINRMTFIFNSSMPKGHKHKTHGIVIGLLGFRMPHYAAV